MKKFKKIILIFLILIIVVIAGFCFYYGYILTKASKPKAVYNNIINKIDENIFSYFKLDKKYELGDNFKVDGEVIFDLDGTYYLQNSSVNPDDIKIYNRINNLTNSTLTYNYVQNNDDDKIYKEIDLKILEEQVLLKKVFIENATEYVYYNTVTDKYINNGNNVFFETITNSKHTIDNIEYLHEFIINSLNNNLKDSYFKKSKKSININDEYVNVYQMSISIDNKRYVEIVNNIIKDIKKDERANNIICGTYKDFDTYKLDINDMYLDKNESYTINVYTDNVWYKPIKYEVLHLNDDLREVYSYIGDTEGELTFVSNDEFKYHVDVDMNHKYYLFEFEDANGKDLGKIKLDKNVDMYSLDVDLTLDGKSYLIGYTSKIKDFEKNKKYTRNNLLNIKYSENDIIRFSGNIKNNYTVNTDSKIIEEVGDVVIRNALTEEEETNYTGVNDYLKERFER